MSRPNREAKIYQLVLGMRRNRSWALVALAASLLPALSFADIYKYTDADGVDHFTNNPHGDGRYRLYMKSKDGAKRRAESMTVAPSDTSVERFSRYPAKVKLTDDVGIMNRAATEDVRADVWSVVSQVLHGGAAPNTRDQRVVDLLDNVVYGSTPDGNYFGVGRRSDIPIGAFTDNQAPPEAGRNHLRDSIAVRRAWAEVETPFGLLKFGRQPNTWGMGIYANGGGADPMAFPHDWHRGVLADFLDAIENDRQPRVNGEEALKVHRFIDSLLR